MKGFKLKTKYEPLKIKMKIKKWENSLIRDKWGNLTKCYWNEMAKEEILKLKELYN